MVDPAIWLGTKFFLRSSEASRRQSGVTTITRLSVRRFCTRTRKPSTVIPMYFHEPILAQFAKNRVDRPRLGGVEAWGDAECARVRRMDERRADSLVIFVVLALAVRRAAGRTHVAERRSMRCTNDTRTKRPLWRIHPTVSRRTSVRIWKTTYLHLEHIMSFTPLPPGLTQYAQIVLSGRSIRGACTGGGFAISTKSQRKRS
jgi:hypothetical protein